MAFSEERVEEIKELIKSYTIRDPGMSCRRIAKVLGIDKMTANKYLKEIRAERVEQLKKDLEGLEKKSVGEELVETKEEFREAMTELWKIITSKESTKTQKIHAIRTLVRTKKELFDMMFDAGIFSRKLGELKLGEALTQEEKDLIKKAINLDYGKKPKQKPKPDTAGDDPRKPSTTGGEDK